MAERQLLRIFWWLEAGVLIKSNSRKRQLHLTGSADSLWIVDDIYSCIDMIKSLRHMETMVKPGQIKKIEELYRITNTDYFKYAVRKAAKEDL